MEHKDIEYKCGDTVCKTTLIHNEVIREPHPGILFLPTWMGLDSFIKEKAEAYAKAGYITMTADLFGNGKVAKSPEEAGELILPLFLDRQLLRDRVSAALEAFSKEHLVNKKRIFVIGYCFGGLTGIELLRTGANVCGIVSIHGILGYKKGNHEAVPVPATGTLISPMLLLHGYDDPMVSPEDLKNIQEEFTKAGIDWQLYIYGGATHGFTNPGHKSGAKDFAYNQSADYRATKAIKNFLDEKTK